MNILDIIILLCFTVALVQGIRKGFIAQVISIISIIAGIWLSFKFAKATAAFISRYIELSESITMIIAFTIIFIIVILGLATLGKLLEATIKIVLLGWLNRLLGAIFSILKCSLIVGLCIWAFNTVNTKFNLVDKSTLAESQLYYPLNKTVNTVFPYLKEITKINK